MYRDRSAKQSGDNLSVPVGLIDRSADGTRGPVRLYVAGAVRDAAGTAAAPGALAVRSGSIIGAGPVKTVTKIAGPSADRIDAPDRLLIPALVNAHTHLDLTHIGPRPYRGDFIEWVHMIRAARAADDTGGADAVRCGVELSRANGVGAVGDIAGRTAAADALLASPMRGASFIELFGLGGEPLAASIERVERVVAARRSAPRNSGARIGLQPHAPYSAGPALYRRAAAANAHAGVPICTHLAETPAELAFVAGASGPFRELLEGLGAWDAAYAAEYAAGEHPIDWLAHRLAAPKPHAAGAWLCAHCNYTDDSHIETLARLGWSVAYCPRASDYFGHRGHRYRDMLAAGVNVCLGTDSIICSGTLSILDEMRHLYQRDGVDPDLLLRLGTVNGMRALGLSENEATFAPGAPARFAAVRYDAALADDPLEAVLRAPSVGQASAPAS